MRYLAIIFVFGLFTISHCTVRAQAKVTTAQVNLTWDAPSSSPDPVAGYNVYRAPGGSVAWVQLNPTPLPLTPTAYSDLGPAEGQTWDYIAESVDALGVTSAPSNMASVVIPDFLPPTLAAPTVTINP